MPIAEKRRGAAVVEVIREFVLLGHWVDQRDDGTRLQNTPEGDVSLHSVVGEDDDAIAAPDATACQCSCKRGRRTI